MRSGVRARTARRARRRSGQRAEPSGRTTVTVICVALLTARTRRLRRVDSGSIAPGRRERKRILRPGRPPEGVPCLTPEEESSSMLLDMRLPFRPREMVGSAWGKGSAARPRTSQAAVSRASDGSARADLAFAVAAVLTAAYYHRLARRHFFTYDDWGAAARPGALADLFEPFNSHLSVVPLAVYRSLFRVFGLEHSAPFRPLGITFIVALATGIYIYVRQRLGAWPALIVAMAVLWVHSLLLTLFSSISTLRCSSASCVRLLCRRAQPGRMQRWLSPSPPPCARRLWAWRWPQPVQSTLCSAAFVCDVGSPLRCPQLVGCCGGRPSVYTTAPGPDRSSMVSGPCWTDRLAPLKRSLPEPSSAVWH